MKTILICPSERPTVGFLAEAAPLAAAPLLGESLIEYWLSYLQCAGVREVAILAHDRADYIEALVGNGERWGIAAQVIAESRELSPGQALLKYEPDRAGVQKQPSVAVLDHLPGMAERLLFNSYADWFAALCDWMPSALTPDRIGFHEQTAGVFIGMHSHVAPEARLSAPCWIGKHAFVGSGATLGPNTIVEDGAFVEPAAEVEGSYVGPDTFIGRFAQVSHSLAWGNTLINWQTGSTTKVGDAFLMCALRHPRRLRTGSWLTRLAKAYARNKDEVSLLWKHLLLNRHG